MTLILNGILSDYREKNLIVTDDLKIFLARFMELEDVTTFMGLRVELWNEGRPTINSQLVTISNVVADGTSNQLAISLLLKPVKRLAKEFLMIDDEYDSENLKQYYRQSEDGNTYILTSELSGTNTATLIKDIIINDSFRKHFRFMTTGSDGHADVIGMYCSQKFGINLTFERIPGTRDMLIFYSRN